MENNAQVIAVMPDKIRISVKNIEDFKKTEDNFAVGSYLRISDSKDCAIIAMVENYSIEKSEDNDERQYIVEAVPIGFLDSLGNFTRGGNNIAIPPTNVEPAQENDIQAIYNKIKKEERFAFCHLRQNSSIEVPVNGNRFFNKHFAIVGSTGSGKSHAITKILQNVKNEKNSNFKGLNNSHIIIFDIHSEYQKAFPDSNYMDVSRLKLPYWLMNGEELEEMFVETGENQAYNQINLLQILITANKTKYSSKVKNISFDTAVYFSIDEVLNALINLSKETRNAKNSDEITIKGERKTYHSDKEKYADYFKEVYAFEEQKSQSISKGTYNDGSLDKFIFRIKNKIHNKKLSFLFGPDIVKMPLVDVIKNLLGYGKESKNTTIYDLSGVPFEVLSITVSLISRLLFECGYYMKQLYKDDCIAPLLLIYEEAHKYVPKINDSKYNSSRIAIERIAKEGRKYGVTLGIISQRPSEISETIFSQCSNFVVMRLTNPQDQNYVKRLLPDDLGDITESLPTLGHGDAIIIGDSIIMPSIIKMDPCKPEPNSNDIKYFTEWKKPWRDLRFEEIVKKFQQ